MFDVAKVAIPDRRKSRTTSMTAGNRWPRRSIITRGENRRERAGNPLDDRLRPNAAMRLGSHLGSGTSSGAGSLRAVDFPGHTEAIYEDTKTGRPKCCLEWHADLPTLR